LSVTGDGTGVVAHADSVGLRLLADRAGVTGELSRAVARGSFTPRHDRGRVLVYVAVMLADGVRTGAHRVYADPAEVLTRLEEVGVGLSADRRQRPRWLHRRCGTCRSRLCAGACRR
jgi:hypothetical protein